MDSPWNASTRFLCVPVPFRLGMLLFPPWGTSPPMVLFPGGRSGVGCSLLPAPGAGPAYAVELHRAGLDLEAVEGSLRTERRVVGRMEVEDPSAGLADQMVVGLDDRFVARGTAGRVHLGDRTEVLEHVEGLVHG